MARKIRIAGLCLVVLIIIAAFSAMSYAQSNTVADVEKSEVVKTAESGVALEWKKVSAADGYNIYCAPGDSKDFEKVGTVKGAKTTAFTVKKLEQAQEYKFYVTAYKEHKDGNVESEEYETLTACTLPATQKLSNVTSSDVGKLRFEREINSKASG